MTDRPFHLKDARFYTHDLHPAIPEGEKWASVTTILGLLDKSGGLVPWATKLAAERFAALVKENSGAVVDALTTAPPSVATELLADFVADAKGASNKERDAAGARGTRMHDRFEEMLLGTHPPADLEITTDEAKTILALHNWIVSHEFNPTATEFAIANPAHKYAGRADAMGYYTRRKKTKLVLVDLKTSKSLRPSYLMQLGAYFSTPECQECDGAILIHAPIPCDEVSELYLSRADLKRHYKRGFLHLVHLWNEWWEEYGGSRVKKGMMR